MRLNTVKQRWREGGVAYGAWLTIPASISAEAVAHQGFDYACVDMQHGVIDYSDCLAMLTAISTTDVMPFVRVPWNEFSIINRVLDAGAMGIIVPMVNSPAEAREAVRAARYHPEGARSWGPIRASLYAGSDYYPAANAEVALIAMVETRQALDALDDILAVEGIDAVYVGPSDLSITLGLPPGPDSGGAFEDARVRIARACAARGVAAGIHANAALAAKHRAAGYRMITVFQDLVAITAGAGRDLEQARSAG